MTKDNYPVIVDCQLSIVNYNMSNPYISPFAKPVYVMLKPVGSVCNLACEYCYYLEKGKLYPEVKNHVMSEQLLEKFI